MAVEGGTASHYFILVIRKFIDFMSLFRHNAWFSLQSLEYANYSVSCVYTCVQLIRIGTAEALSYRCFAVNLKKVKVASRYRAFSSSYDLFTRIVLDFNFEFKVLTDQNKQSEML